MERLLTEVETSERVNRAVSTMQKDRCVGGGVPFVKIGRQVRYRESDVESYIKSLPSYRSTSEIDVEHGLASMSAAAPLDPVVSDEVSDKDPAPRTEPPPQPPAQTAGRRRLPKPPPPRRTRPRRRSTDPSAAEATPT